MNTLADKTSAPTNSAAANVTVEKNDTLETSMDASDQRPVAISQRKLDALLHTSPRLMHLKTIQSMVDSRLSPSWTHNKNPIAIQREETDANTFISDNGTENTLSREAFLAILNDRIQQAANKVLAQINQTAAHCPYIAKWFAYYSAKDAAHIEEAIQRYAPATAAATSLDQYLDLLIARVIKGLQHHVNTGSIEDVPEEIVEEKHEPEDFLHIATQADAPMQMSCLFGDKNKKSGNAQASDSDYLLAPVRQPAPRGKMVFLDEGESGFGQPGDSAMNGPTTSCGLVLIFGDDVIGCYHWPFMAPKHFGTFKSLASQVGGINRIVILSNDFPSASEADYKQVAKLISSVGSTDYFVIDGNFNGTPWVDLKVNDFTSKCGRLRKVDYNR